ncbi:MAG: TlpA family protein disulfide reductase [Actinomycetota bacterium]
MPSRREFLAGALATVAVACTGGKKGGGPTALPSGAVSIDSLTRGAQQLSLLGVGPGALGGSRDDAIQRGSPVLTFDLALAQQLIEGGTPQVYVAQDPAGRAFGPFSGSWQAFTGYEKTHDRSPKSPIPGVYAATVRLPTEGLWTIAVVGPGGRAQGVGVTHAYVGDHVLAAVGTRATSVKTPVATTEHGLREICTRQPPCPMHALSLDDALGSGKPTVAVFSTPLLCESRLCGPVTDEAILVSQEVGGRRANFLHIEEFLPGPDLKPDAGTLSPAFRAWGFVTEPWTIVIDRKGFIRQRFEGSVTADVIDATLRPLL